MSQFEEQAEQNKIICNDYQRLAQAMLAQGVTLDPYLKANHLTRSQAFSPQHRHSFKQFWQVLEQVINTAGIKGLGLKVGAQVQLTDYGILGYAMLSGSTLREVSAYGIKYRRLSSDVIDMSLHISDDFAIYRFWEKQPRGWSQPYHIEEAIASSWKVMNHLLPDRQGTPPVRIDLAFAKPEYSALYETLFQCPVYFKQSANQIVYPRNWLDLPISSADEMAAKVCSQQCSLIIDHLENRGDTVEKVRRILLSSPMLSVPGLSAMAIAVQMSERTLRRRLYEAGTHYKNVVNEVRIQLAVEYLNASELSMQEIAYLVGYDHSPNFCRAFKKIMGTSPSHFKNKRKNKNKPIKN